MKRIKNPRLSDIFGSESKERILTFICARNEGYVNEIARFWKCSTTPILKQIDKLEANGVLVRKRYGKTDVYRLSPRYYLKNELRALLTKAVNNYNPQIKEELIFNRRRPRMKGKSVVYLKDMAINRKKNIPADKLLTDLPFVPD